MYFENCKTLEELKKLYRKLVMKLHPDVAGAEHEEEFKIMNNEYDDYFEKLKNYRRNKEGTIYEKETNEVVGTFKNIIEKIIHFENVNIEIIGDWIWVSGNTKNYKDILKDLKFKWGSNKSAWYYYEGQYKKFGKKTYTMNELRAMWGTENVETEELKKLEA